jgi:WD40 repeat protein
LIKQVHGSYIVGLGVACNGKFVMSCAADGEMIIWSVKGEEYARINVCGGTAFNAKVTPCGRYVAACGMSPDVVIHEVKFSAANKFEEVSNLTKLVHPDSSILDVAFSDDSARVGTITKSGKWTVWDISR